MVDKVIKYTSNNGYTGRLYGKSSYAIYDKDGHECFHTGFRNINTYDELVEEVDNFPKFLEMLQNVRFEDIDEDCDI